jgi:hypothetical protein
MPVSGGVFHNAVLLGEACLAQRAERFRRAATAWGATDPRRSGTLSTEDSRQQDIAGSPRWRAEFDETMAEQRRRSRQSAE